MMADVACFCGCLYSFEGGGGACPKCGEYVSLTTGAEIKVTEYTEYATDLHFLAQLVDQAQLADRAELVDRKTALCAGDEAPQGLRGLGVALGVHHERAGQRPRPLLERHVLPGEHHAADLAADLRGRLAVPHRERHELIPEADRDLGDLAGPAAHPVGHRPLALQMLPTDSGTVYVHRIAHYYIKCFDFVPYFANERDGVKKSEDYKPYRTLSALLPVRAR